MNSLLINTTVPATFISHKRGQRRLRPHFALLRISNVTDAETAAKYVRNAVYFSWTNKQGELVENRGIIRRVHGSKGVVRAVFERNLSPLASGQTVYVKLYKIEKDESL
jgi:large subunit ribosomal protein L35Ae